MAWKSQISFCGMLNAQKVASHWYASIGHSMTCEPESKLFHVGVTLNVQPQQSILESVSSAGTSRSVFFAEPGSIVENRLQSKCSRTASCNNSKPKVEDTPEPTGPGKPECTMWLFANGHPSIGMTNNPQGPGTKFRSEVSCRHAKKTGCAPGPQPKPIFRKRKCESTCPAEHDFIARLWRNPMKKGTTKKKTMRKAGVVLNILAY